MNVRRTWLMAGALVALAMGTTSVASAQWGDPEGGDTWEAPPPEGETPPAEQPQQDPNWQQERPPAQPPAQPQWQQQQQDQPPENPEWSQDSESPPGMQGSQDSGESDHASIAVGNMGIGWFGVQSVSFPNLAATGPADAFSGIDVPTIGARIWVSEALGIDVGLGFMVSTGGATSDTVANGTPTFSDTSAPFSLGIRLYAGLPIALYHAGHFTFLVEPELAFGFATGDNGASANLSGLDFSVGAQTGAEIQFGFIDIPQLSLQATVGVALSYRSVKVDDCPTGNCQELNTIVSANGFSFGTGQYDEPWDIFKAEIAAIYYFE